MIFRLRRSDIFATQKRYCRFAAAILYSPPKLGEAQYHLRSKYNWRSQYNSPKANIAENTVIVISQLRCFLAGAQGLVCIFCKAENRGSPRSSPRRRCSSAPHLILQVLSPTEDRSMNNKKHSRLHPTGCIRLCLDFPTG